MIADGVTLNSDSVEVLLTVTVINARLPAWVTEHDAAIAPLF